MAPRRRLVLLVGALVAVLSVAALVAGLVLAGDRSSSGGGAAARRAARGAAPGPVLLVTGYGGSTRALDVLAAALRRAGRDPVLVPVAGDGTVDLHRQARELDAAARAALRTSGRGSGGRGTSGGAGGGAGSVDVVGYSAGGVVARVWLAGAGRGVPVRRVVTLGSPHRGTDLAVQAADLSAAACPTACRQLEPGSDLLDALPDTPGSPAWTSVWSETDEVVVPARTASSLPGALEVDLQRTCPGAAVAHGQLPTSALGVGVVDAVLDGGPLRAAPPASRCAALTTRGRELLAGG